MAVGRWGVGGGYRSLGESRGEFGSGRARGVKKAKKQGCFAAVGLCVVTIGIVTAVVLFTTQVSAGRPTRLLAQEASRPKKTKTMKSTRAGLTFPVGRISSSLRRGKFARRVSDSAAVMMAAVIEYLTADVLELAGNMATDARKSRIIPRHIFLGVKSDEELSRHLQHIIFHEGGVVPSDDVMPPKSKKKKLKQAEPAPEVLGEPNPEDAP
eukprot:1368749-Amorphochlora_amoeboformis.AAC.1